MPEDLSGLDLMDLRCFLQVVEAGSFSAAAQALGLPKATLSRRVAALERHLGMPLLVRTTRSVRCTAAGTDYARRTRPALAALLEAGAELAAAPPSLRGPLRIRAPRVYGEAVLAPRLAAFQRGHPDLGLELWLAEEGGSPDLGVVIGGAPGPERVPIDSVRAGLFASPALAHSLGPLDYAHRLDGVAALSVAAAPEWALTDGVASLRLRVRPVLRTDSERVVLSAAEAGLGVALLPTFLAADATAQGRLVPLFPAWHGPAETVFAAWPGQLGPSPAVRALVDHLGAAHWIAINSTSNTSMP